MEEKWRQRWSKSPKIAENLTDRASSTWWECTKSPFRCTKTTNSWYLERNCQRKKRILASSAWTTLEIQSKFKIWIEQLAWRTNNRRILISSPKSWKRTSSSWTPMDKSLKAKHEWHLTRAFITVACPKRFNCSLGMSREVALSSQTQVNTRYEPIIVESSLCRSNSVETSLSKSLLKLISLRERRSPRILRSSYPSLRITPT